MFILRNLLIGLIFFSSQAFAESDFMMEWDGPVRPQPQEQRPRPTRPPAPPKKQTPVRPPVAMPPADLALPQRRPPPPARPTHPQIEPEDARTEATANVACPACDQTGRNIRDLQAVVTGRARAGDLSSWRRSRGLVQVPTRGDRGNIGPCGSFHYNPDRGPNGLVDNYAAPITACAFMSLLQDWKKKCPDSQAGCRVAWGDISHATKSRFNGHSSHTHGNCIDIRPMRRGRFDNAPLVYQNSDRNTTAEFIRMARAKGGSPILYNDPQAGAKYSSGHHNHMHICFHNNKKTKETCANYRYDANVCGPN